MFIFLNQQLQAVLEKRYPKVARAQMNNLLRAVRVSRGCGHARSVWDGPAAAENGSRGAREGYRASDASVQSRASRATGGVWARVWAPSVTCARRSRALPSPGAVRAPPTVLPAFTKAV